jgi:hypothetical protein
VGPVTRGALASGAWDAIGDLYTAVGRFAAEEKTETHTFTTVYEVTANWQLLAHERLATPEINRLIDGAISELIERVRRTAYGTDIDGLAFEANNCFDLAAPSLASMTLLVSALPTPWAWAETFRMDLVADRLLPPADLFMPGVDYSNAMHPAVAAQMAGHDPGRYEPTTDNYRNLAARPDALRVYFDPGSELAGETGLATADVPYSEMTGAIRPSIVARARPGTTHAAPAGPHLT